MTMRRKPVALVLGALIASTACSAPAEGESGAPQPVSQPAPASASPTTSPPANGGETSDATASSATRCGWFENPTPGNAWLSDRDRTWIVGTQGGHQADGDWPAFGDDQWIVTNGSSYGYGCACMSVRADADNGHVLRIDDARALPLSRCRADPALEEPRF
ncbi:DUF4087 domain-containing protein [Marilutibacter maris]|uniref:DUF4087 domain-containing protein n=1 Tax=Marilutibacter maris TaxID=1605891 RepID=UPI002013AD7A|nr:DUF4087 domain-containing protein [Lysobacter maris]